MKQSPIAKQIAEALEAAHEQGIIHRDLKPANIKVRPDGTVKVLDFGLAKLAETSAPAATGQSPLSMSPTITSPAMTGVGVLLGTAAYMAPEQAKGRPADKRTDVWAFGCVLYEMLTGRRAFDGEDVTDTLASILMKDPDWSRLPPTTPAAIRKLLRRCLEKDRKDRLRDAGDALVELKDAHATPTANGMAAPVARHPSAWRPVAIFALAILVSGGLVGVSVWLLMRPSPPQVTRTTISPSSAAAAISVDGIRRDLAVTPDGKSVVYVGNSGTQLFVRSLDRLEATALAGLGTPVHPFVSPDGQWIGFFDAANILKKVAITGGPAVALCPCGFGGTAPMPSTT